MADAQLNILIIDDDPDQQMLLSEVLQDRFGQGCVRVAGTGTEALSHDLQSFDMILSDYNLPDTTGMELLAKIRARTRTPVIMVTGENDSDMAAEAITRGATDYVVKVGDYIFTIPLVVQKNLTVAKLTRENEQLRTQLEGALADVQKSLLRVEELAATDPLTQIYNRRHFSIVLEQLFSEASRYQTDLSLVMIDLDGYKQLNDGRGHQIGDEILVIVGKLLRDTMRKSDVAARYGGDEFVLLLPRTDAQEAHRLVCRVRDSYRELSANLLGTKGMTMSIGVASYLANAPTTADRLIASADAAMYSAKQGGRDRIHLATGREASRKAG